MLYDVDKSSDGRETPSPNSHDVVAADSVMAKQTISSSYRYGAQTSYTRVVFKNNLYVYYDDQNRIIKVDGFVPQLVNFPVTIQAQYGYDVFTDILGIARPTGL